MPAYGGLRSEGFFDHKYRTTALCRLSRFCAPENVSSTGKNAGLFTKIKKSSSKRTSLSLTSNKMSSGFFSKKNFSSSKLTVTVLPAKTSYAGRRIWRPSTKTAPATISRRIFELEKSPFPEQAGSSRRKSPSRRVRTSAVSVYFIRLYNPHHRHSKTP